MGFAKEVENSAWVSLEVALRVLWVGGRLSFDVVGQWWTMGSVKPQVLGYRGKCPSFFEKGRRVSGKSRRYFGKYGSFLENSRRKNKDGTRTDVICLRKMEHCAAVPSYEICRCRNENFGK